MWQAVRTGAVALTPYVAYLYVSLTEVGTAMAFRFLNTFGGLFTIFISQSESTTPFIGMVYLFYRLFYF